MDEQKLQAILDSHKLWLYGKKEGARADLRRADLSFADLRDANLRGAELSLANLRGIKHS